MSFRKEVGRCRGWVAGALTVSLATFAWADVLLVSTIEDGMMRDPCIVYRLDETHSALVQQAVIPGLDGIRSVDIEPEGRYLAIWQYTKGFPEEESKGKGRIVLVDLSRPDSIQKIYIDLEPVFGGVFCYSDADQLTVVAKASWAKHTEPVVTSLTNLISETVAHSSVSWDRALFRGMLRLNEEYYVGGGQLLRFRPDFASARLVHYVGPMSYPTSLAVDTPTLERMQDLKIDGGILSCANKEVALFRFTDVPVKTGAAERTFIYNKTTKQWSHFAVSSENSDLLLYNDWIVERQYDWKEMSNNEPRILKPNGKHVFYKLSSERAFEWNGDLGDIPLLVMDHRIIYRNDTTVWSLEFDPTGGVKGDPKRLCTDDRLKYVCWAAPVRE